MKRFLNETGKSTVHEPNREDDESILKRQRVRDEMVQKMGAEHLNVVNSHPNDSRIRFIENGHYYVDENGKRFRISVTGLKSLFCYPFDKKKAIESKFQNPTWDDKKRCMVVGASARARELPDDFGLSRKEVYEKMNNKGKFGTEMHAKIENYINRQGLGNFLGYTDEYRINEMVGKDASPEERRCAKQVIFFENQYHRERLRPFRTEWVISSKAINTAGQIDLVLAKDGDGDKPDLVIVDWKTTTHLPTKSFTDWVKGSKFLPEDLREDRKHFPWPLNHMGNIIGNEFLLQESLYAYILREMGYKVVEIRAVVINPNKQVPVVVKSKPLFDEVEAMVEVWNNYVELEKIINNWEKDESYRPPFLPSRTLPIYYNKKIV